MKKKGHPPYQDILFIDTATGFRFVCGSTLQPKDKEVFEGKEYPAYKVSTSSSSHPFFTGNQQFVDAERRIDKFNKKYSNKKLEAQKFVEKEKIEEEKEKQARAEKKEKKSAPKAAVKSEVKVEAAADKKKKGSK